MDTQHITAPWSPVEIETKMAQVITRLEEAVTDFKTHTENAASARYNYKVAEAGETLKARTLEASGGGKYTVDEKKAWVYQKVCDLELAYQIADGEVAAQKEVIRSLQSQAELLRSLARSSRDLTGGPGYGNGDGRR